MELTVLSRFLSKAATLSSIASSFPEWVGNCTGFCDQSKVTLGSSGKKLIATNNDPLIRFPVFNSVRNPRETKVSITR
ncbi:MAG: hypothetical protein WDM80_05985 [Limisphaerales bacterium]